MPSYGSGSAEQYEYDTPSLSRDDRDMLNELCPFFISDEDLGYAKIVQVSRKSFIGEFGSHHKASLKTKRYSSIDDLDDEAKVIYAKVIKKFFVEYNEKIVKYTVFRDKNPQYFI